jgi:hypothetical protein
MMLPLLKRNEKAYPRSGRTIPVMDRGSYVDLGATCLGKVPLSLFSCMEMLRVLPVTRDEALHGCHGHPLTTPPNDAEVVEKPVMDECW